MICKNALKYKNLTLNIIIIILAFSNLILLPSNNHVNNLLGSWTPKQEKA